MIRMQPFDEGMYHGEICHVEQVWDDPDGHHWCLIRPTATLDSGVYIIEQEDLKPIPEQGAAA